MSNEIDECKLKTVEGTQGGLVLLNMLLSTITW